MRSTALARVKSLEIFEYPTRVFASSVKREPSVRVSSPPVMGCTPRLLASLANSSAPQRLVVRQRQGWVPVLLRPRHQLVHVRRSNSEGVEALGMKLDIA